MTTVPVRILNAVRPGVRPVPVDAAFEATPPRWCWSCKRHLNNAEFPDPGVRCLDCMASSSRVRSARLALRFLTIPTRPVQVRRLVAWRCLAAAVVEQARLYDIDLTSCPLPEPGHHRKDTP